MPQIGPLEILVVAVIALIVFGPQKLPEIARSVGRAASELRRMATEARSDFESGLEADDDEAQAATPKTERPEAASGKTERPEAESEAGEES